MWHAMKRWLPDLMRKKNPLGLLNAKFKMTRGCEDTAGISLYVYPVLTLFPRLPVLTSVWRHDTSSGTILISTTDVSWPSDSLEISLLNIRKWNIEYGSLWIVNLNKARWQNNKVITQGKLQKITPTFLSHQTLSNKLYVFQLKRKQNRRENKDIWRK